MEYLINKYGVRTITIFDDLFIVNKKRLREIVEKFVNKRFNIEVFCAIRANLVDEELCSLLKKMNVKCITFGAESFSEPVLKSLKGGSVTVEQNKNAVDMFNKYGIEVNCSIIFDSPEQTKEDMITTWAVLFDYLKNKKIHRVGWGLLRPYPGSYYWDIALKKGLVDINMDWNLFRKLESFHMNDHLTIEELNVLMEEWDTKCYVVNLDYRDAPQVYSSKAQIFIKKENLFKKIQLRPNKDEIDTFITNEYEQFLSKSEQHQITLLDGWYSVDKDGYSWIKKYASFAISPSVIKEGNIINLNFFIPDITYYKEKKIEVKFIIHGKLSNLTFDKSGFHQISVFLSPLLLIKGPKYLKGEIITSDEFIPNQIYNTHDTRNVSILIIKMEIAKGTPNNPVSNIYLPRY
jgi:hypothetical protein